MYKRQEQYPVPERLAPEVTEIEMDGGSEIYTQLCPFWDGEDGAFDLNTITEDELRQFPNLKHITLMSSKPEQVLPVLERCGIKADVYKRQGQGRDPEGHRLAGERRNRH